MALDLLRQGDLATWSSPEAAMHALANPDAARQGAPLVEVDALPVEARPTWVLALTAWWQSCQDAEALCHWIGSRSSKAGKGSPAHRAAVGAACICARSILHLVEEQDRMGADHLLSRLERWARTVPMAEPATVEELQDLVAEFEEGMSDDSDHPSMAIKAALDSVANDDLYSTGDPQFDHRGEGEGRAVDAAAVLAAEAVGYHLINEPSWDQAITDHLSHLADLIRGQVSLEEALSWSALTAEPTSPVNE